MRGNVELEGGGPPVWATTVSWWITLGALPVAWTAFFLASITASENLAFDFRYAYLPAAEAVLHGDSPYPISVATAVATDSAYVYPPPFAYALVPFTYVSESAASILAVAVCVLLMSATLLVLGVRDWRCFGVTFLWAPTMNGLEMASASIALALATAIAWKYRDTARRVGASLGLSVALKLFVWPLLVWTLATNRLRATGWAVVAGGSVTLLTWSLIGFADLGRYPDILRDLADLKAEESYSLIDVGTAAGLGRGPSLALATAVGAALLVACVALARRGDDFRSFTCAIAAALAFTPILWQHYLVLLVVPLAIARPRFSGVWVLPVLLWVAPRAGNGDLAQTLLPVVVATTLVWLIIRPARSRALTPEVAT